MTNVSRTVDELEAWLRDHPAPTRRQLAESGFLVPSWPRPYGRELDAVGQLDVESVLRRHRIDQPVNPVALAWVGPALLDFGTPAQQERHLWPIVLGDEIWCQLFSEPDVGSDLASTRTQAVRDGDVWRISGQKIWTSWAHESDYGLLLARTSVEDRPHRGLTFFLCPMNLPGITIRPIIDMTGCHTVNEVFFDDVLLPSDAVLGALGGAWTITRQALVNERWIVSGPGLLWGGGATIDDLIRSVSPDRRVSATDRQRLARLYSFARIIEWGRRRAAQAQSAGAGAEVSVYALLAAEAGTEATRAAIDLCGADGLLDDPARRDLPAADKPFNWRHLFLYSPSFGVGGGTSQVQRSIIGESLLGLPREPVVRA